jgi:hypothetical protein
MWEIFGSKNDDACGKPRILQNEDFRDFLTPLGIAGLVSSCRGYNG